MSYRSDTLASVSDGPADRYPLDEDDAFEGYEAVAEAGIPRRGRASGAEAGGGGASQSQSQPADNAATIRAGPGSGSKASRYVFDAMAREALDPMERYAHSDEDHDDQEEEEDGHPEMHMDTEDEPYVLGGELERQQVAAMARLERERSERSARQAAAENEAARERNREREREKEREREAESRRGSVRSRDFARHSVLRDREMGREWSSQSSHGHGHGHGHHGHGHGHGHAHGHAHDHAHDRGHGHSQSVSTTLERERAGERERERERSSVTGTPRRASTRRGDGVGLGVGLGYAFPSRPELPRSVSHPHPHAHAHAHSHPHSHSHSHTHSISHSQAASQISHPSLSMSRPAEHNRRRSRYGKYDSYDFDDGLDDDLDADAALIVDDKVWTEGDFELVSADRVRFRIPSYYLFASSAIFRDASALGEVGIESGARLPSKRHVHFTDDGESAAVLRLFLEFIVYAKLEVPDDGTTLVGLATVKDLVTFLKKWECSGTLSLFLVSLREAVRAPSNISPLAAFIAGATAGDAFTCSVALDITDWSWRMMDRHNLPAAPDANVFDPHHMPVAVWQLIPPMYTWALTTAWTGTDDHLKDDRRRRRSTYRRESEHDSASRCDSVLSRKVHAWQQWL